MEDLLRECKGLVDDVVTADAEALGQIQRKLAANDTDKYNTLSNYEKQQVLDAYERVRKLVEVKKSTLNHKKFRFVGEPVLRQQPVIAPQLAPELQVQPNFKGVRSQKLTIDRPINHMYVDDVKNTILVNDNHSNLITIHNAAHSVLSLHTPGTVHVTEMHHCVLVVGCHQLRIHRSSNCQIIATVSTTVIIEDCQAMRFSENVKVDDFNWNFAQTSSNYTVGPLSQTRWAWVYDGQDGPVGPDTLAVLADI